jgi:hypothetical protein
VSGAMAPMILLRLPAQPWCLPRSSEALPEVATWGPDKEIPVAMEQCACGSVLPQALWFHSLSLPFGKTINQAHKSSWAQGQAPTAGEPVQFLPSLRLPILNKGRSKATHGEGCAGIEVALLDGCQEVCRRRLQAGQ